MKTMANQDKSVVVRVSEEDANILQHEGFRHVPKQVWKEYQKNQKGYVPPPTISEKSNEMSKSTKRHLRKQNENDQKIL
jgi:hypothetical protein